MVGFIVEDGCSYAGKHLLLDLHDCANNSYINEIEKIMVQACEATGATVLFHYSHPFEGNGNSGAVILAESHGTWHQWPERNFIAIDIFVCGNCNPELAIPILKNLFLPGKIVVKLEKRGALYQNDTLTLS